MDIELVLLRVVHITAGVLWVGSAVFYLIFVDPVVKTLGPAAPRFMQELIEKRKYPIFMFVVSSLTILAGAKLYWDDSGGLKQMWIKSDVGLGYTIGSVAALLAYIVGFFFLRPRAERMGALGKQIGMAGGPPSAAHAAELEKLDREILLVERIDAYLLIISLVVMATARYWSF
jgi:hypothetical protein